MSIAVVVYYLLQDGQQVLRENSAPPFRRVVERDRDRRPPGAVKHFPDAVQRCDETSRPLEPAPERGADGLRGKSA